MTSSAVRPQKTKPQSKLRIVRAGPDDVDPHIDEKATQLLQEEHSGDDHFPGDVNLERIHFNKDLPPRRG
jgi:hypothetical protein